ncbi:MAG: thiamine-phosphate kinase [Thermodesulfobacteria bacterium]|nr:thiamine-phosphate kinase [Thermodesulfobacteriota bacterium]
MTEEELLKFLAQTLTPRSREIICGVGDDCAVVETADRWHLFTMDTMVEGVHFSFSYFTPYEVGRKLAAVNLSDIAAMGGIPKFGLLSLSLPEIREDQVRSFLEGLLSKLSTYDAELVGGDVTRSSSKGWHLSLSLSGETAKGGAIFRSGGKPGDALFVSRPLGASAAALELWQRGITPPESLKKAHLDPEPEIRLGQVLAENHLASAMIDVSDGLLLDLKRLCEASGLGAIIFPEKIPVPEELRDLPLSRPPLDYALAGGEDFALLFAVPPSQRKVLKHFWPAGLYEIGKLIPEKGIFAQEGESLKPLPPKGFDHFA